MKKVYLSIIIGLAGINTQAQVIFSSNFSNWTAGSPDGFMGAKTSIEADSLNEITGGSTYGASAAQIVNMQTSHKRLSTQAYNIVTDSTYEIEFWVKGNGQVRAGMFDGALSAGAFGYQYGSYITINSTTWENHTMAFTADTTTSAAEFLLSVKATSGAGHIQFDSIVIRYGTPVPVTNVSIYEIQYTSSGTGDSPLSGQTVNTGGVVTAVAANGYYIQDNPGAWNGIYVYDSNPVSIGDSLTFTAEVVEFYNLTELKNLSNFNKVSSGNVFLTSFTTTANVNMEAYEGVMVTVTATCTDANTAANFGMWTINDGSGACLVDDVLYAYIPTANSDYQVTGVVDYSYSEYKILPRDANDVSELSAIAYNNLNEIKIYPIPASDFISITSNETLSYQIIDYNGKNCLSGVTNQTIKINELTKGLYLLKLSGDNGTIVRKIIVE